MGSYSRKRYATESASFPKSASSAPGSYSYATFDDLPASGSTPGNTAFVVATNKLYIWSGVGWYLIATVTNASPTAISGVNGSYSLAIDGTATTITAVSTDPEGFSLTWSYAVSSGSLGSTATVAQADNVFTITPSTNTANAGTFSLTFSVTDGLNGVVSAVSAFTLSFVVQNSRYTALSVKATATGSNQTFDDASTSNHTITASGNVTASTFSPYRHGGYATYFDGNDRIDISTGFLGSHTTGNASTSTFTIESWVYQEARGSNNGIDGNAASIISKWVYFNFGIDDSGHLHGHHYSGSQYNLETTATVPLKTWTHVALVVTGAQIKLYINGTLGATGTWYGMQAGTSLAGIGGSNQSHPEKFTGYMHDIRVSDNARYTTNFTPADALTTDSNTDLLISKLQLRDLSSNSVALTLQGDVKTLPFNTSIGDNAEYSEADHGASVYFDGSGDYLTGPTPATIGIGTGDFTIECWFYATDATTDKGVWDTHTNASNSDGLTLTRITATTFRVWQSSQILVSSATAITNHWNHLAVVRNSGTLELFVNGVSQGTVSNSANLNSAQGILIGGGRYSGTTSPTQFVKGYIQDFRVTTSAVYTSAFTPPTAPLTTSPTYPALAIGVANSGASAYTLSGGVTGSNATVNMAVGQTVNFTVNASGHPFYIRVSDGGANVSTPTATGQGATSGVVSWTPNTAGTYYYQCGNHAGMIGTINVTDGVKFLLNPETSISDLSQRNSLTCYGNVATDATTVKFAGTKSIAFNGTGDYIVFSNGTPSTTDLTFDEEFTIEFWAYLNATNVTTIFYSCGGGTANWSATTGNESSFFIYNGKLYHQSSQGGSFHSDNISIPSVVQTGEWQHWAVTCDANADCKWYLNGTLMWSYAHVFPTKKTGTIWRAVIGAGQYLTDDNLDGYIQDFRITKGLVRYTSNFTPPTELQG